ncbi:hypothetical protein IFM89_023981 [Coptis chinensis]|uniref:Esterase n=1 Tax=Coptis chinensis TaxID=261450 RepID=A0A835HPE1_9MAGN|nr:hypothetical protein IFM89_023981 [Coptis chinensis]
MSGWFSVTGQVLALSSVVTMVFLGYKCEARCEFKAIFNFGDSNSDTGGFWAAFPAQSAPYGMTYFKKPSGRATDGRLIIDFLGKILQLNQSNLLLRASTTFWRLAWDRIT